MAPKKSVAEAEPRRQAANAKITTTKITAQKAVVTKTAGKKSASTKTLEVTDPTKALSAAAIVSAAVKGIRGGKAVKQRKDCAPYRALVLRNLPASFQEPEVIKFLSQFGTSVSGCFVVRTKQSNRSRGTAYVKFAESTTAAQYDAILDECHGMLLGNNTVMAKYMTLRKAMPDKKIIDARRKLDWLNKTKGKKLVRYDAAPKPSAVDQLKKLKACAATEAKTNLALKKLGINYEFHGFQEQLDALARKDTLKPANDAKTAAPAKRGKAAPTVSTTAIKTVAMEEVTPVKTVEATPSKAVAQTPAKTPAAKSTAKTPARPPATPAGKKTPAPSAKRSGSATPAAKK